MLKLKVLCAALNNLTDARYFAAYGVDWIGFDVNPASEDYIDPDTMKEIISWVEGPKFLLHNPELNPDLDSILLNEELQINGLWTESEDIKRKYYEDISVFSEKHDKYAAFNIEQDMSTIKDQQLNPENCFIEYSGNIDSIHELLDTESAPGIILRGKREEKVGLKSFDELDAVFDLIY